ncbi:MAG: hypothetical protein OIF47_13825 [Marinibacterium sp.]|nr:hypothetical protein [Marinibacterium sp.]
MPKTDLARVFSEHPPICLNIYANAFRSGTVVKQNWACLSLSGKQATQPKRVRSLNLPMQDLMGDQA